MKYTSILLILFSTSIAAQQPQISAEEQAIRTLAATEQRNIEANNVIALSARMRMLEQEIAALKKQIESCSAPTSTKKEDK